MTMTRTPYADRPHIIARYCTCLRSHYINETGEWRFYEASPNCPLHGHRVADDVPEAWR